MNLTALGVYGPYPKKNCGTSSYLLKAGDKNILLDAGEGSFSRLSAIIPPEELDMIFLSHSHFDHTADVGVYNYYFESLSKKGKPFDKSIIAYFDDGSSSVSVIKNSPFFVPFAISDGAVLNMGGLSFEFHRVKHPAITHSITVCDGVRRFSYTGDTNDCDALDIIYSKSDVVLADGCFLPEDWSEIKPHLSIDIIKNYSLKWGARSIVGHLNPDYDGETLEKEISERGLLMAKEGKVFEI
ncbi:MAG: MBL fold metallo-hydrolase [Clostridia bacterium]|nr:MBL fold metallo-hydrolase [Clostridia bacterium]